MQAFFASEKRMPQENLMDTNNPSSWNAFDKFANGLPVRREVADTAYIPYMETVLHRFCNRFEKIQI